MTGWINLLGQVSHVKYQYITQSNIHKIAGIASSEYGASQMLLAAVAMNSGTYTETDETGVATTLFEYAITTNHTVGVMAALTILTGLVNSLSTKWMEKMTKTYVILHVAVLVSCSIALLVVTPKELRHDAKYVFTDVRSTSGWEPIGFSFLFGFLSVSWTMTDYDATAHITEECVSFPCSRPCIVRDC